MLVIALLLLSGITLLFINDYKSSAKDTAAMHFVSGSSASRCPHCGKNIDNKYHFYPYCEQDFAKNKTNKEET